LQLVGDARYECVEASHSFRKNRGMNGARSRNDQVPDQRALHLEGGPTAGIELALCHYRRGGQLLLGFQFVANLGGGGGQHPVMNGKQGQLQPVADAGLVID